MTTDILFPPLSFRFPLLSILTLCPLTSLWAEEGSESAGDSEFETLNDLLADVDWLVGDSDSGAQSVPLEVTELQWTVTFAASGGFESNPILSAADEDTESAFGRLSFDAIGRWRSDRSELVGFVYYDGRSFAESDFDDEHIALVHLAWTRSGAVYDWTIGGGYLFAQQVFDATTLATAGPLADVLRQQAPSVEFSLERAFGEWLGRVEIPFERAYFEDSEDDFWEGGLRLVWERPLTGRSEWSFFFEAQQTEYFSREERDAQGVALGEPLRLQQLQGGLAYRWVSGAKRRWEIRGEVWAERDWDRLGDYYDRNRYYGQIELRFRWNRWRLDLGSEVLFVDYAARTVSSSDESVQWQRKDRLECSVKRDIGERWEVKVDLYTVDLESNEASFEYRNRGAAASLSVFF